jgi:hypothetical protein
LFAKAWVPQADAVGWAGLGTFTFQGGKAVYRNQGENDYECRGTYEVVEDFVHMTYPLIKACAVVA